MARTRKKWTTTNELETTVSRTLLLLLVAACQGGGTAAETPSCTGKCDASGATRVAPPQLGRCTLVGAAAGHTVRCTYTAPAADFPVRVATLTVAALKQGDPHSVDNAFGSQAFTASGSADILTLRSEQLPVQVVVIVDLAGEPGVLRGTSDDDLSSLTTSYTLRSDGDSGSFALPFTAWSLVLDATVRFSATVDGYPVDLAPWSSFGKTSITHTPALPLLLAGQTGDRAVLVVPPGLAQVTGRFAGGGFTIPGPATT